MKRLAAALLQAFVLATAGAAPGDATPIDDFRSGEGWQVSASDQVEARWRAGTRGHCLEYDFRGVSGYAVVRRALPPIAWPADYEFRLRLWGQGPANHFQFKLTDASGENVWWHQLPDARFGEATRELRIRRRKIQFAWGPTSDPTLRRPEALELVVATGRGGGRGALCFERLTLIERAPAPAEWPAPTLSAAGATIDIDLHALREFSGVLLHWSAAIDRWRDYALQAEDDNGHWQTLRRVRRGAGPLDALFLPDGEARRLRLSWTTPMKTSAVPRFELMPPDAWRSVDDATTARARALPPGAFPRTYRGEQNYWTLFGVDGGGEHAALISEDGAIEPRPGAPSIEPFVLLHGAAGRSPRLVTWADVRIEHQLAQGYLPLPRVRWSHPAFTLDIEAGAAGDAARALGLARYTLRPTSRQPLKATLLLVARPWQVNPPQQFLNRAGGASPIFQASWFDGALSLNRSAPTLQPIPAPAAVLAGGDDDWPLAVALARGAKPVRLADGDEALGPGGRAEAALSFALAGRESRVALAWPLAGDVDLPGTLADVDAALRASAETWRRRLNRVEFDLPPAARRVHDTLRSGLAQILLSRKGPALQPGTRSYARSWVRDGAMMVAALLRLGETDAAREFVDWYARHLFDNGKVPCCVDARGADPVPENDSHGQYIHAVAELWRFTRDPALLRRHWPAVQRAARYMEQLRQSERTSANREPGREAFFGLMPASISHEGYSAKPMHSYWDDFWALRGYKDAVLLAQAAGDDTSARAFAAWRDEFATELAASIRAAVARHRIAFLPGAAELGDFDPTSSTIVLNPAQAQGLLPEGLLEATFERYWLESQQRRDGTRAWQDYTPYELRSVGALVRLQQPARAWSMLDFFFADQRPAGWNQWAEVVMRRPREKHFLGDMPHAWIASDAIRCLLDLFVHETDDGQALVLAAGLPEDWLREGVAVRGLPTPHGALGYRARRTPDGLRIEIDAGLVLPPGGLRVRWQGREHRLDSLPAELRLPDR